MPIPLLAQLLEGLAGAAEQFAAGSFSGTVDFMQTIASGEVPTLQRLSRAMDETCREGRNPFQPPTFGSPPSKPRDDHQGDNQPGSDKQNQGKDIDIPQPPANKKGSEAPDKDNQAGEPPPSREGGANSKPPPAADPRDPRTEGSRPDDRADKKLEPLPTGDNRESSGTDAEPSRNLPGDQQIGNSGFDSYMRAGDYSHSSEDWSGWLKEQLAEPMMIKPFTDADRDLSRELTDWERYVIAEGRVLSPEGKTLEQMRFEHEFIKSDYERFLKRFLEGNYEQQYESDATLQQSSNAKRRANLPNISEGFSISKRETKDRVLRTIRGTLGVPGTVLTHRELASQRRRSRGTGDDAGHLLAIMFGAPGNDDNLGVQNYIANRYGTWRNMEQLWAQKLKNGVRIEATVTEVTRKGETRPFMRYVQWNEIAPNGRTTMERLHFSNPHTSQSRAGHGIPFRPSQRPAQVFELHHARRTNRRRR